MLVRGTKDKEHAMAEALKNSIAFVGIDIGKNSFHVVGLDECGAIVLRPGYASCQESDFSSDFAALKETSSPERRNSS
jgi:hypothetical protein